MGPADQWDVVCSVELLDGVLAEKVAGSSGTDQPALDLVGVGPHEVAHGPDVGDFLFSVEWPDIVYVLNVGR